LPIGQAAMAKAFGSVCSASAAHMDITCFAQLA